ncbi:MAG TPA: dihydroorotate dehydrogenase [Candidatus Norongarragalinales archaeon]|jgi:dihydroorotate dehydrogenase (NAD+) catalytic subunit|nr:dihydroorotate dehydrogenase [Candidatus Norongarragalinales archaeon]
MSSLEVSFCGKRFKNPLVLAAGVLGAGFEGLSGTIAGGAGGVTTKSCNVGGRKGFTEPTVAVLDDYVLNAVGLDNPGVEEMGRVVTRLKLDFDAPVIASVFGSSIEDFSRAARVMSIAGSDFVELDVSCPHAGGAYEEDWSSPELVKELVVKVKSEVQTQLIVKLPPGSHVAVLAQACEDAGADALNCVNTAGGLRIDIETGKPLLSNKFGGVSGKALFPMALRAVHEASQTVTIPIIGTGGVSSGEQAIEMLMAGASLVGIGSAAMTEGAQVFSKIDKQMRQWLALKKYDSISEIKKI